MNTFYLTILRISCLTCLLFARNLCAQEFEIFELDDFISPEHLIVESESEKTKSLAFLGSRVSLGGTYNYHSRNEMANIPVSFFRIANNLYKSRFQFNWKFVGLYHDKSSEVPNFKNKVQLAYYDRDVKNQGRWQLSWNAEKRGDRITHEFSMDLDVLGPDIPGLRNNTLLYGWKPWEKEHFISYAQRHVLKEWNDGSSIKWGPGVSGERKSGHWFWGVFQLELSAEIAPFPLSSSLHIIYSYSKSLRSSTDNNEIGMFINSPVISRLF